MDDLAVVFGAAGGIGSHLVERLATAGMRLALVDIDEEGLSAARLGAGTRVVGSYAVDLTVESEVQNLSRQINDELGNPNLIVISVGWLGPLDKTTWECSRDDWERVLATNLLGPISCVRAFLPPLEAAPGERRIVLISSLGAMYASPRLGAYAAAKRALVSFAETMELELAERRSTVGISLVCPGAVPTGLNLALRRTRDELRPVDGEWLEASDVAQQIVDSVRAGQFYVFTHASSRSHIEPHQDRILASLTDTERADPKRST